MKIFKNYKKLYLNELENRRKLIGQVSKLGAESVDYQKEIKLYKEECGKLQIELEDTKGFLKQETEAKETLKKERTKLRRMVTELGGDWKNGK